MKKYFLFIMFIALIATTISANPNVPDLSNDDNIVVMTSPGSEQIIDLSGESYLYKFNNQYQPVEISKVSENPDSDAMIINSEYHRINTLTLADENELIIKPIFYYKHRAVIPPINNNHYKLYDHPYKFIMKC